MQEAKVGEKRELYLLPTKLEFPDLEITFSVVDFELWKTYFLDFVIMGDSGPDKEIWSDARRGSAGLAGLIQMTTTTQMTSYRLVLPINMVGGVL